MNTRIIQIKLEDQAGLMEQMDKISRPRETHKPAIDIMRDAAKYIDELQAEIDKLRRNK